MRFVVYKFFLCSTNILHGIETCGLCTTVTCSWKPWTAYFQDPPCGSAVCVHVNNQQVTLLFQFHIHMITMSWLTVALWSVPDMSTLISFNLIKFNDLMMIVLFLLGVFNPVILHPNVFPSGKVSLSLIDKNKGWKPQITTKEVIIKTIFTLLHLMFW